jgi:hypothetical protein
MQELNAFASVLNKKYKHETAFDEGLFVALRDCLFHHKLVESCRQPGPDDEDPSKIALDPIVFSYYGLLPEEDTDGAVYAIGIARKSSAELMGSFSTSGTTNRGLVANRLDHCSCLLKRTKCDGKKWTVVKSFSNVELKIGSENDCINVKVEGNKVMKLDLQSGAGAVGQAMLSTMAMVLPSHAEVGEITDLLFAAIIGKMEIESGKIATAKCDLVTDSRRAKDNIEEAEAEQKETESMEIREPDNKKHKQTPSIKYRWIMGKVFVPEKCGEFFFSFRQLVVEIWKRMTRVFPFFRRFQCTWKRSCLACVKRRNRWI